MQRSPAQLRKELPWWHLQSFLLILSPAWITSFRGPWSMPVSTQLQQSVEHLVCLALGEDQHPARRPLGLAKQADGMGSS
ncbi:Spermatogenesis-Associated Protein 31C2-Like [Manis pentadactyla]|nr:Spermatogenesis-Associated Protein 31C2-Like [Manis pentadactyla]